RRRSAQTILQGFPFAGSPQFPSDCSLVHSAAIAVVLAIASTLASKSFFMSRLLCSGFSSPIVGKEVAPTSIICVTMFDLASFAIIEAFPKCFASFERGHNHRRVVQ